jgi:hypothetical protein
VIPSAVKPGLGEATSSNFKVSAGVVTIAPSNLRQLPASHTSSSGASLTQACWKHYVLTIVKEFLQL